MNTVAVHLRRSRATANTVIYTAEPDQGDYDKLVLYLPKSLVGKDAPQRIDMALEGIEE
jgi:hypothetical protein